MKTMTLGHRALVNNREKVSIVARIKKYFDDNALEIAKAGLSMSGCNTPYTLYRIFEK